MNKTVINEKISFMEGTDEPLSADIGIVKAENSCWLYDVGNGENAVSGLPGCCNAVLSHFHSDHIGNISRIRIKNLYLSKQTCKYIPKETLAACRVHVVNEPIEIGCLRIFPLPSSHAKGSLGLEIDGAYAFVGDALYCKTGKDGCRYNAQLLKNEIDVLKALRASFLLVSHCKGFIRSRAEVVEELEKIYAMRTKNRSDIPVG